jgi:hypothetical protein
MLALLAALWISTRTGMDISRLLLIYYAGLVFAVVSGTVFLISFFSYLAFVARARGYIRIGDAVRLAMDDVVSIDAPARVHIGVPARTSSAFLSVRALLEFNSTTMSRPLTLGRRSKESLALSGQADVPDFLLGGSFDFTGLPSGRYDVTASVLRFEDPLGFFRFCFSEREHGFAFTVFNAEDRDIQVSGRPDRSNTEFISRERTKMEGELLDIRKYVPGSDSSRRIVWKLFARTGRLMVRDAERENVNSSRLPLFVSFHTSGRPLLTGPIAEGMLEEYKSSAFTVIRRLKEANFQPVYCPERRVPALEAGDTAAFQAFDAELEPVPAEMRAEVEMACHTWQPDCDLSRQLEAWSRQLRGIQTLRSRLVLITHSLDGNWLEALEGEGASVFLKRLSREFFQRADPRSGLQRLLFTRDDPRPWEVDLPSVRLRYGGLVRALVACEDAVLAQARARGIEVTEI